MPIDQNIRMCCNPRGNVIRTVIPDNSEQWAIHGKPHALNTVDVRSHYGFKNYRPTPWESYIYDANDFASRTNDLSFGYNFTPSNSKLTLMLNDGTKDVVDY
jgi:hypothetical protein